MDDLNRRDPRNITGVAEVAIAFTVASALTFLCVFAFRAGPNDQPWSVFVVFLFAICPVLVSATLLGSTSEWSLFRLLKLSAASSIALCLPALGLLFDAWVTLILVIPVAAFSYWLKGVAPFSWPAWGRIIVIGLFVAMYVLAVSPAARFLMPESASLGMANTDQLFHATLAQMIKEHGYPSLAGDGLTYYGYHFASHTIAAGLSVATDLSILATYVYWGTLSLKLQLFWFIYLSVYLLNASRQSAINSSTADLIYATLVLFAVASSSESYSFGLALFLGLLPLFCAVLSAEKSQEPAAQWSLLFLLVMAFVCAASKTSIGFYCAVLIAWAALQRMRHLPLFIVTFAGLVSLAAVTVTFLTESGHLLPLNLLRSSYSQYLTSTTLLSYALPIAILTLTVIRPKVDFASAQDGQRKLAIAWSLPSIGRQTPSELLTGLPRVDGRIQVVALMTASCLVVLFTVPIGSNVAYFSLPLLCVSTVLLPFALTQYLGLSILNVGARILFVVGLLLLLRVSAFEFPAKTVREVGLHADRAWNVDKTKRPPPGILTGKKHARAGMKNSFLTAGQPLKFLRDKISDSSWAKLVRLVREMNEQQPTAVHVSANNEAFWRRLSRDTAYWCMTPHLMLPAEAGAFQIKSVAPLNIEKLCSWGGFTFYGYGRQQDLHRSASQGVGTLCREARRAGVKRVYVLHSIDRLVENKTIDCSESSR